MEPLTAIILLAAQYGIREVVAALTGNQEMSALAGEVFRQMSASEDRLSSHLTSIEVRLDQVLEQPYETAIGAGQRGLLDVVGTEDSRARREDLMQVRERFRDASAAARSPLQVAMAERYLLLCAIALGRQDAAKTALGQLNRAATTAALDVYDTMRNAVGMAHRGLEQRGEARGFGSGRRLDERLGEIRHGAEEAARLVENLLCEAGVVGQTLGQTQPPSISTVSPKKLSLVGAITPSTRAAVRSGTLWYPRWHIMPNGSSPVRVGAFVVTWDRLEPSGPVQLKPTFTIPSRPRPGLLRGGGEADRIDVQAAHSIDVQVDVKIEVDPPLSRSVPLALGWGSVRDSAAPKDAPGLYVSTHPRSRSHTLPAGARLYHLKETVSTSTNPAGKITEVLSVRVGAFEMYQSRTMTGSNQKLT